MIPAPGYFETLSNKENLKVRLDGIAFNGQANNNLNEWVFKLSDGKSSNGQSVATIPQIENAKRIILFE